QAKKDQGQLAARAPHPPSGHLLPQAGEGLKLYRARRRGGAFFAPGFFAQAKKGGSRRHGAKALDLDVGGRAAGQDPPYGASGGQQAGQDPPYGAGGWLPLPWLL